jgi:hypothetical protein
MTPGKAPKPENTAWPYALSAAPVRGAETPAFHRNKLCAEGASHFCDAASPEYLKPNMFKTSIRK